jgi:hypothetical protein
VLAVFVDQLLVDGLQFHGRAPFVGKTLGFGFASPVRAVRTVATCSGIGDLIGDLNIAGDLLNTVRVAGDASSREGVADAGREAQNDPRTA